MRVLWITNGLFPEAISQLAGPNDLKGSGGWMLGLSAALLDSGSVQLTVAGISSLVKRVTHIKGSRITYYAVPQYGGDKEYDVSFEKAYRDICIQVEPDVVHIHGTEFPHSLAALRSCGVERTLVSIQGLVSVISAFYYAGITKGQVLRNLTFRDIVRGTIVNEQCEMKRRGEYEKILIQHACFIGGRTSWDRDNILSINPDAQYFNCGEILRQEFYSGEWVYEMCRPHSIFMSQASSPIKGLHKVLDALTIVKRRFPDVQLRIAGYDITYKDGTMIDHLRLSSYGRIIRKMIKSNHLSDNVTFIGSLNANEMKKEYLLANVFVCPSSIENSPNSLGEAQILGVPCVASYVGGVMDMMKGDENHLYRFEETGMLAAKICQVFEQGGEIDTALMREVARNRHDVKRITTELLNTYRRVLSRKEI